MGLADAVVAVAVHIVAGVAVVQVDIGRAVGVCAGAELRQVTRVTGVTAWGARWLQLQTDGRMDEAGDKQMKGMTRTVINTLTRNTVHFCPKQTQGM